MRMIDAWFTAVDEIAGNEYHILQGEKALKARLEPVGCCELKKESRRKPRMVDVAWLTTARFTTTTCIHVDASGIPILAAILPLPPPIVDGLDKF